MAICGPLAVRRPGAGEGRALQVVGATLLAVVFAVCYLFFAYAFTSVWCFFAAVLSLLVCYGFYRY